MKVNLSKWFQQLTNFRTISTIVDLSNRRNISEEVLHVSRTLVLAGLELFLFSRKIRTRKEVPTTMASDLQRGCLVIEISQSWSVCCHGFRFSSQISFAEKNELAFIGARRRFWFLFPFRCQCIIEISLIRVFVIGSFWFVIRSGREIRAEVGVARPVFIERDDLDVLVEDFVRFGSGDDQGGDVGHKVVLQGQTESLFYPEIVWIISV